MAKINKDSILISLFIMSFLFLAIYSWATNNFLAKTFVKGLEGCAMFTSFVLGSLFN